MMQPKTPLSKFNRFVLIVNCFFAVLLLLSYLAPVLSPDVFWPVAFLGLGYFILLIINVLFVGYWLFGRRVYTLVSLIAIVIGVKSLSDSFGLHPNTNTGPKQSASDIRVMNYNVHDFNISLPDEETIKPKMIQLVKEQQPDVIAFEEFYSWRKQNPYQTIDSLKKILHTEYYYFEPSEGTQTYDIGLAIFSKLPIVAHGPVPMPGDSVNSLGIYVDVKAGTKTMRVYGLHLQSLQFEEKDYNYLGGLSKGGVAHPRSAFSVIRKLKAAFIRRSKQVAVVKQHTASCPYPYVILGDFNDTPTSYAVNQMEKGLKNAFKEKGYGLGKTFNGNVPNFQIDYIMATPQFDVLNYRVIKQKLSDHYPVVSDLVLK